MGYPKGGVALRFPPHSKVARFACYYQPRRMSARETPWPHAPEHRLGEAGTYFVTAATYQKAHHFRGSARLEVVHRGLLTVARDFGWRLEAWAVFSNHYHLVGHSPRDAETLRAMLAKLHERTAKWVNKLDATPGRKVWHNFHDTRLTFEKSYLARLSYTHRNAVRHGLVPVANQYPWCSAAWFERVATPAEVKPSTASATSASASPTTSKSRPSGNLGVRWQSAAATPPLVANAK
jgi:putative transposase